MTKQTTTEDGPAGLATLALTTLHGNIEVLLLRIQVLCYTTQTKPDDGSVHGLQDREEKNAIGPGQH